MPDEPDALTETYRRAGDMLTVRLLDESSYIRKRIDDVFSRMAVKEDIVILNGRFDTLSQALNTRLDSEVRALKSDIATSESSVRADVARVDSDVKRACAKVDALDAKMDAQGTDITGLMNRPQPNLYNIIGTTAAITGVVFTLLGVIVFLIIALKGAHG